METILNIAGFSSAVIALIFMAALAICAWCGMARKEKDIK